jgi:hypothetical protein
MKTFFSFFFFLFYLLFLFSCSNTPKENSLDERQTMIAQIDSVGKKMFDKKTMQFDKELAFKGISLYKDFAAKFPNDSLSAEYLFRMADLQRGVGDNRGAILTFADICKKYPDYKRIPDCIFLQGYYYQEFFNDTTSAKYYYNELISKYPSNGFVDDAKALMNMFGKSEEQIIKEFEQKQSAQKK